MPAETIEFRSRYDLLAQAWYITATLGTLSVSAVLREVDIVKARGKLGVASLLADAMATLVTELMAAQQEAPCIVVASN